MKRLIKYTIIILLFYTFGLGMVPLIFSRVLPVLTENISENSEFNVNITNPKLKTGLLPIAVLTADRAEIKNKTSADYVSVNDLKIRLRVLPLLSGRVHINKISSSSFTASSSSEKFFEADFWESLKKTKIRCDNLNADSFNFTLCPQKEKTPVIFSGQNLIFQADNKNVKINVKGEIKIQNSSSEININLFLPRNNSIKKSEAEIEISNLNLEPLGGYLKQYLPEDLVKIQGLVNLKVNKNVLSAIFKKCSVIMKDEGKSIIFPEMLEVNSDFDLAGNTVNIKHAEIKSENINTVLSGTISDFLHKSRTALNLKILLNHAKVENIINLLPPFKTEDINVYKLKKYKFYGDSIGNFSVSGNIKEPEINGEIFINNGILTSPIEAARGASIKLRFTGKYVNFDATVPAGNSERVWVKGGVELYNVKYSDMRIWSTKQVNLKTAREKLVPLHEILNFILGPIPIMDMEGRGNIDITVKGNRANPHIWGVLNLSDFTARLHKIPNFVITNAEAVLNFNDQDTVFTSKHALANGKNVDIQGTANLVNTFNYNLKLSGQDVNYLYNTLKTSEMLEEAGQMMPDLDWCSGASNLDLNISGQTKSLENLQLNKNLSINGRLELLGNTFVVRGIKIQNTKGVTNFTGKTANTNITSYIGNSLLELKAEIKDNIAGLTLNIPRLNLNDAGLPDLPAEAGNMLLSVEARYNGAFDKTEYDKLNLKAKVLGVSKDNRLQISDGTIELKNNKLSITNLKGSIAGSQNFFNININADNFSEERYINGNIKLADFNLPELNKLLSYPIFPADIRKLSEIFKFNRGKINLNCRINNNKVNFYTDLGGVSFDCLPLAMPVKIINGSLIMRNNNLQLNKINLIADEMPVIADGNIFDIFSRQNFDMYFNIKPSQEFIDKYINKNRIYPVKIKGDIVSSVKIKGEKNNFDLKIETDIPKEASVYYLGAAVGDIENALFVNLDTKILNQNNLKIREFSYDKMISSLDNRLTRLNMLKARGGIKVLKDDLVFDNLQVKTKNPTDARIFNIIFRKPNIKQGQFTSDLKFNGRLSAPKLLGDFHILETNIPFLDTTLKNITLNFKNRTIEISSDGNIFGNDISINGVMQNKLSPPYSAETIELKTKLLDIDYIVNKLKQPQTGSSFETFEGFDLSALTIKNLKMSADSVLVRNMSADSFTASASLDDNKVICIDNFGFSAANGVLTGKILYDAENGRTELEIEGEGIDANCPASALFDLDNQIYGSLTGSAVLSCTGEDFNGCMETLGGKTVFRVTDGSMPKLGSLEYLLRAGNLVKSGITGLSINSVIDIITPLKTGNFSEINGSITINDGVADDITISTTGKNLSLYITGKYDFASSIAGMKVFGLLSKKISTLFGPIGNLSLNTLFNAIPGVDLSKDSPVLEQINKIPGIEISGKAYRKFMAEIQGNINGEDYVTVFEWIN